MYPRGPKMPLVYIGDAAFELDHNCLTPYPGAKSGNLSKDKNIFNYRLSRARRTIENAFGILVALWRIFRTPIKASLNVIKLIVLATVCLHNMIMKEEKNLPQDKRHYCPDNLIDQLGNSENNAFQSLSISSSQKRQKHFAKSVRDHFKDYFMGPGKVPWQEKAVFE